MRQKQMKARDASPEIQGRWRGAVVVPVCLALLTIAVLIASAAKSAAAAQSLLYVADRGPEITIVPLGSNALPHSIGTASGVLDFVGVALDSRANIYALSDTGLVAEFAAGSSGTSTPVATLMNGIFAYGKALALDGNGNIYVAKNAGNASGVVEFAAGSKAGAQPVATITGAATGLSAPMAIAVDSKGMIYVSNNVGHGKVLEFAAGSNGNVSPVATIAGDATGLNGPLGFAVDARGNLYVVNWGSASVTEYAPGSSGNAKPIAAIAGDATGIAFPHAIALDQQGNIYVANQGKYGMPSGVTEYPAGANGNAKPVATIAVNWNFYSHYPVGLAILP